MATVPESRVRELAEHVAFTRANNAVRNPQGPGLRSLLSGLSDDIRTLDPDDFDDLCDRVAALSVTAGVTVRLPKPAPEYDVAVFYMENNHWFGDDGWTWCQVIDGDARDYTPELPHCTDEADARAKAQAWLDEVRGDAGSEA